MANSTKDLSHLPIRAQIALQRFDRIAAVQKSRLAAFVKAQPTGVGQSTRHEMILKQIKNSVIEKSALTAKAAEHFKELSALIGTKQVEEIPAGTPPASPRKRFSTGE